MERKTLIAASICLLVYIVWQKFYVPTPDTLHHPMTSQMVTPTTSARFDTQIVKFAHSEEESALLESDYGIIELGKGAGILKNWTLKHYKQDVHSGASSIHLQSVTNESGTDILFAFDDSRFLYLDEEQGSFIKTKNGFTWTFEDQEIKLVRDFTLFEKDPYIDVSLSAEFKKQAPKFAFISVVAKGLEKDPEAQDRQLFYWTKESIERALLKDTINQISIPTVVGYIGAATRYFSLSIIPKDNASSPHGLLQFAGPQRGRISLVYEISGNSIKIPFRIYFGPKELELLRKVDPRLDHTVDFGWFTLFAYPILKILKWLYKFVNNYGLAIILLTLLLKVVTYPLTYKSMKTMKKMAKLQPQLQRIKERYQDDKEALNREMLNMMRNQGYNPVAGCLPMLVQMPIFFALYRVLYSSIELYHAPFAFWIHDLSSHDPYYVTPILLSLTLFIQQKLTPNTATDPVQAKMMQFMPLIFGVFMLALPAGLTIYMLVNAIASIAQQIILNKKLDASKI